MSLIFETNFSSLHFLHFIQFSRFDLKSFLFLVGTNGLEPSTSRLSGVRSNHLSYAPLEARSSDARFSFISRRSLVQSPPHFLASCFSLLASSGGDEEDRTPDPLLAKQVLSQLSYTPAVESSHEPSKLNNETTSELPFFRPTLSGHP